jgi:hypothetical protein
MSRRSAYWGAAALTVLLVLLIGGAIVSPALGRSDSESTPTQVVSGSSDVADLGDQNLIVVDDSAWSESDDDHGNYDEDDHDHDDHESRDHEDDEHEND